MTRLREALAPGKALIPYLTASDPSEEAFFEAALGAIEGGARVLEVGIPFSEPVADGPVIQAAHQRALRAGGGAASALSQVRRLREAAGVPIVLFSYLNPVLAFGLQRFAREARDAGADGILLLDAPPAEEGDVLDPFREAGLDTVVLVTPNTTRERAAELLRRASGFVYLVSRSGVTGANGGAGDHVRERVRMVRGLTDLPVAVGFGVADSAGVSAVWQMAEGAVVGSALVNRLEGVPLSGRRAEARDFVRELSGARTCMAAREGVRP